MSSDFYIGIGNYWAFIPIVTALLLSVVLFIKRRDLILVGVLVLQIVSLIIVDLDQEFALIDVYVNNSLCILSVICQICAVIAIIVLTVVNIDKFRINPAIAKIKGIMNKFWLLPGLIYLVSACIYAVGYFSRSYYSLYSVYFKLGIDFFEYLRKCYEFNEVVREALPGVTFAIGLILLAYWLKNPWAKERPAAYTDGTTYNVDSENIDGYCGMAKHILLSIFTFGIWAMIWTYRTTKFLNRAPHVEQYSPAKKLLLCMFVPFYQIYWYYKHGQRIDAYAQHKKLNTSDMATLCLILGIFIPVVANFIMQDRINAICTAKGPAVDAPVKEENTHSSVDELKEYKALLDTGVITQEEFDAKKKQLLEL